MSEEIPTDPAPVQPRKVVTPRVWGPMVLALLAVLVSSAVYGVHEHNTARRLAAENREVMASLDATRSQFQALTNRLNNLTTQPSPSKPAASQSSSHGAAARRVLSHRRPVEDLRWKQIQMQLAEQQKQIEANHQDLGNARTELQGSIARTHDELVVLERKGERNYYEFDLDKNRQFERKGPVGLRLHKANSKQQNADLDMLVDDIKLSKKHVNLYEPVFFYSADNQQPVELVINSISKNHIRGYLDEPKYKSADLEAMANGKPPATAPSSGPNVQSRPPRQHLEVPKNMEVPKN
jgi:transcriptional regulator with PAS, ATPase and Fis domain